MNYQSKLENIIMENQAKNQIPTLLLHVCCAPCSSYVLEYLSKYFKITILYYNPNISPFKEYQKRKQEVKRLLQEFKPQNPISFLDCDYDFEKFKTISKGLEKEKEGGTRCIACYYLRMEKAAIYAKQLHFDYFTTTLSISPYKNAQKLNELGEKLALKYSISYLYADFKKKNGYKRSIELSKQYNLYRQDYCGCIYSKLEREEYVHSN